MTKHAYDAWADANLDNESWGPTECAAQRDAAVNTLRDVLAIADQWAAVPLPPEAAVRIARVVRASLVRLGVPVPDDGDCPEPPPVDDLGGPSFDDDAVAYIGEEVEAEPPPF